MSRLAPLLLLLAACPNHTPRYERGPQNRPPPAPVTCADEGQWSVHVTATSEAAEGCDEILLARLGMSDAVLRRDASGWHVDDLEVDLDAETEQACTPRLHVINQSSFFHELGAESGEIAFDLVVDGDEVSGSATTVAAFSDRTCTFTYAVTGASAAGTSTTRDEVTCGDKTCSADEYCELRCTCCGVRVPEPGEASGTATCLPLPDSCKTGDGPECQQRTVEIPCA
jgi:hypothetical protein